MKHNSRKLKIKKKLKIYYNTYNVISYKFLTKLNCFRPLAKGGVL